MIPFRRRRRWTRAQDYGATPARRWNPLMVMLPLAAFTGVYLWDGPPPAAAVSTAPPPPALPRGWDADPAAMDAAQPFAGRAGASGHGGSAEYATYDELDAVRVTRGYSGNADARFGRCGNRASPGGNCVIDGDTFWFEGEKVRIADINTPEVSSPGCAHEAELGARATDRLQALLNQGAFELETVDRDRDKHGRLLRVVTRGGESVGRALVDEGLAEDWQGYRRDWC